MKSGPVSRIKLEPVSQIKSGPVSQIELEPATIKKLSMLMTGLVSDYGFGNEQGF